VAAAVAWPRLWRGRRHGQAACCDGPMPRRAVRDVAVCAAFVCFSNWLAQASQRAASWFQLARSSGLAVERAILRHSSACRRNSAAGSIFRSHDPSLGRVPSSFHSNWSGCVGFQTEAKKVRPGSDRAFQDVGRRWAKGCSPSWRSRSTRLSAAPMYIAGGGRGTGSEGLDCRHMTELFRAPASPRPVSANN
jgi:hypothetical protein